MGLPVEAVTELTTINCECGGVYAISERYRDQKHIKGGYWHCPYCMCSWGFFGESRISKLEKELELERKRTEWAKQDAKNAEYRRRAVVGKLNKIKKRVSAGVCPCCQRTFQNVARHMKCKHPDYK